jgi:predicted nucleotidyltransferase
MKEEILEKLKSYFDKNENVIMAFLFGSLSKGKVHKHSDIDIAIYLKEYDINEVEKMWNDLEDLLKKDIDLIVLNISKPLIAFEAIRGDKIIIRDYDFYTDYMLDITSEALDLKEFILDLYKMRRENERY